MAYVARARVDTSGLWGAVCRWIEDEALAWEVNATRSHSGGAPFPSQRILDGARAGRAVNVPLWALPVEARRAAPKRRVGELVVWPDRAVVRPDNTVVFNDENATALWLEEAWI